MNGHLPRRTDLHVSDLQDQLHEEREALHRLAVKYDQLYMDREQLILQVMELEDQIRHMKTDSQFTPGCCE